MKVQANHEYIYWPNMLDQYDARTSLVPGSIVRVVNMPGCPRANTMGHAHVEYEGKFAGLVHTNSLHPMSDAKEISELIRKRMDAVAASKKLAFDIAQGLNTGN